MQRYPNNKDAMARKYRTNNAQLNQRWREVNDILADLANLHVWPTSWDIAEIEGELLQELDEIEFVGPLTEGE